MGAVCKICGKDMMKAKGCSIAEIHIGGKVYDRIKVGAPEDFDEGRPETTRCHDCNALFGPFTIGDAMQNAVRHAVVS